MAANSSFPGGDVNGPASSTDGAIAVFNGTNGKAIKVGSGGGSIPSLTGVDSITFSGGKSINGATANTFISTATGPYVFGSSTSVGFTNWMWTLAGTYAPAHAQVGGMMRLVPTITMPNAVAGTFLDVRGLSIQTNVDFGGKTGALDQFNMLELDVPVLSNTGGVTIHNTAQVHTFGDMTATVTGKNYSLWIDRGTSGVATSRFDGDIYLAGHSVDITAGNTVTLSFTNNRLSFLNGTKAAGASIVVGDGAAATPSITRFGQETGIWFGSNSVKFSHSGTYNAEISNIRLVLYQALQMGFSPNGGAPDMILARGAANRLLIENAGESVGVALDASVDGTLSVLTRAGADTAITKSNVFNASGGFSANGTAGVAAFGPAAVASITVKYGLVVAIS